MAKRRGTVRRRGPNMSLGELMRKLWQPESEEPEPKVAPEKKRKSAGKGKRGRKSQGY
jgi:hypothetical protein